MLRADTEGGGSKSRPFLGRDSTLESRQRTSGFLRFDEVETVSTIAEWSVKEEPGGAFPGQWKYIVLSAESQECLAACRLVDIPRISDYIASKF